MFDGLQSKLGDIFDALKKRGALKEADVDAALRDIRVALLEADVALSVVKTFIEGVRGKAVGQEVLRSVQPGQQVVKIVYDHMVEMLGGAVPEALRTDVSPPACILMVGLQGSGKTTTSAKIGLRLKSRDKKKVLMASLDIYRPAAQQQLQQLGQQTDVQVLAPIFGEQPVAIAKRAMQTGRTEGYDAVILDTAGRLHIDQALMAEVQQVRDVAKPAETLLVVDAMTGQDAVNLAKEFDEKVGITGIVLTRVDGDARGGAALSMRAVTGKPIKLLGTGEKMDALDAFDANRVAGSILGMGDVVGLVEKALQVVEEEEAEKLAKKMMKGEFTLEDMVDQFRKIRQMGSLDGILGMLPGAQKAKQQMAAANIDDKLLSHQEAIILAMTPKERSNPKILNGSRRRRIAEGSGTTVQEVNRVLKQHKQMSQMMKKVGKMGKAGMMRGLPGGGFPPMGGGMPPGMR
jgi:signal recognition particle subunit SRP54